MLEISNLSAGYEGVPILTGLSLCIGQDTVAILGRNGVGKTTLLRSIMGIADRFSGTIALNGAEIGRLSTHTIARRGVAYVPQGRGIFPKLTVRENLAIASRSVKREAAEVDVISLFPVLGNRLRQLGGTLSGGEQQMLAIARALLTSPKVLLLDEPSEGIQPSIVRELETVLPEIAKRLGLSLVVVEQNIDLAKNVGQRILFMEKGRIIHECRPEDMKDQDMLTRYLALSRI